MTDQYHPDLQSAVDQRLTDRDTEQRCASCGKPFVEHMGIVGTCAELKAARARFADLKARLHTESQNRGNAAAQVEALTKERDEVIDRLNLQISLVTKENERLSSIPCMEKPNTAEDAIRIMRDWFAKDHEKENAEGIDYVTEDCNRFIKEIESTRKERDSAIARAEKAEANLHNAVGVIQEREAESRKFAQECDRIELERDALKAALRECRDILDDDPEDEAPDKCSKV
jgi:hypothetical protein